MSNAQLFFQHVAQTSRSPLSLEIERAEGCWLFGKDGKKYLDFISGISVSNLGHNHPVIAAAIREQLDHFSHLMVYGEFIQAPQVRLAAWLATHLPEKLSTVFFTNSGTEAVEGAIKLAKRLTGRSEIISFANSYHGSTSGALSLGNNEERRNAFRPLVPGNRILQFNNIEDVNQITDHTAAVILEPVQAEAGVIPAHPEFITGIRKMCDETGALMILDECQTGMGRTGQLFAFMHYGTVPDILIVGKAFGGGMPLGGFISSLENMNAFTNQPVLGHLTTFGGHPVCCAAGLASASELINADIVNEVNLKSEYFQSRLNNRNIVAVRSSGLLLAIQFASAEINFRFNQQLIEKGLIVDWFLFAPDCMRIAPPLTISMDELQFAAELINAVD